MGRHFWGISLQISNLPYALEAAKMQNLATAMAMNPLSAMWPGEQSSISWCRDKPAPSGG